MSNPHKKTLAELIVCLLENNKAHICKIGEILSVNNSSGMACTQRIRRFLSNIQISPSISLIPLIHLMRPLMEKMPEIVLIMDRTDWGKHLKYINILSVAVSYKGRAIPLYQQILTRSSAFKMNVLLTWGKEYDEPLVVATTAANPVRADLVYGKRFNIEPMHKDWKTNAFDLEKTRVNDPKRIETLLIPIAFAYTLCVIEGELKEEAGEVRKPAKGKTRMIGLFLDGIRTISKNIMRTSVENFKIFILNLIFPFCKAWDIQPSDILPI